MTENPSAEARRKKFAKNFKEVREFLGYSQAEIARKCGMTPAAVCNYEKGDREPGLYAIVSIVNALGCTFERLIR